MSPECEKSNTGEIKGLFSIIQHSLITNYFFPGCF